MENNMEKNVEEITETPFQEQTECSGYTDPNEGVKCYEEQQFQDGGYQQNQQPRDDGYRKSRQFENTNYQYSQQFQIPGGKSFMYQRRVAADKVDADFLAGTVQRFCILDRIAAACCQQHGNGRHGYTFVNNRDSVQLGNILTCANQISGFAQDFIVHLFTGNINIAVTAIQKRNPHGYGADIQIFVLDHIDGFHYIA